MNIIQIVGVQAFLFEQSAVLGFSLLQPSGSITLGSATSFKLDTLGSTLSCGTGSVSSQQFAALTVTW